MKSKSALSVRVSEVAPKVFLPPTYTDITSLDISLIRWVRSPILKYENPDFSRTIDTRFWSDFGNLFGLVFCSLHNPKNRHKQTTEKNENEHPDTWNKFKNKLTNRKTVPPKTRKLQFAIQFFTLRFQYFSSLYPTPLKQHLFLNNTAVSRIQTAHEQKTNRTFLKELPTF